MARSDREQSSFARRDAAIPFAALPAVALAAPAVANDVALQGTDEDYIAVAQRLLDTMSSEDAAPVGPGREWIEQFRAVLDANQYLADLAEARPTPPPPEALFWRESDAELDVKSYYLDGDKAGYWAHRPLAEFASVRDADGQTWFAPADICTLGDTHFDRGVYVTGRGSDVGVIFERKVEHIRELLDAKDKWFAALGTATPEEKAGEERLQREAARILTMEDALGEVRPHTLQGLMFKAVVAARSIGTLEELASYPDDHNPLGAVVCDLVAMALGNLKPAAA